MPMKPAAALATAPSTKPPAYHQPSSENPRMNTMGTPTMAMVRYWRFRKAIAPSLMASAISFARSFVAGALRTRR